MYLTNFKKRTKIRDINKLNEYISYCLDKDKNMKIKSKTSNHHILPRSLFPEFEDLGKNNWNSCHLLYNEHYIAHSLLAQALEEPSSLFAWYCMSNQDKKTKKVEGSLLLDSIVFQELMERRNKLNSENLKGKIPWNKGLDKTDERVRKYADNMSGIKKSEKHKEKLSLCKIGKVSAINIETNKIEIISKEIFATNRNKYKGINAGKKIGVGAKNPMAKRRLIVDENNKVMFTINGNLKTVCIENCLPYSQLNISYKNGIGIFLKKKTAQYRGWKLIDNK